MPQRNRAQDILTVQRRELTTRLRLAGMRYKDIVTAVIAQMGIDNVPAGYDERYACKDVKREISRLEKETKENVTELRHLEVERLMRIRLGLWNKVLAGDRAATMLYLKTMEQLGKYIPSLFVPTATTFTDPEGNFVEPVSIYLPDNERQDK